MHNHRTSGWPRRGAWPVVSLLWWIGLSASATGLDAGSKGLSDAVRGRAPSRTTLVTGTGATRDPRQSLLVEAQDVVGEIGQSIPLKITLRQASDVVVESVKLLGLPAGFVVKDAAYALRSTDESDILNLTDWKLSGLSIEHLGKRSDPIPLSLVVIWKPKQTDSIEVSVTNFTLEILARRPSGTRDVSSAPKAPKASEESARAPEIAVPSPRPVTDLALNPAANASTTRAALPRAESASLPASGRGAPSGQGNGGGPAEIAAPAPLPSPPLPPRPLEAAGFVERAKGLIARGDISGARLFLERARARNEANATLLLAQTWDPEMLRQWNVRGLRPDPERARALYREAAEPAPTNDRQLSATQR